MKKVNKRNIDSREDRIFFLQNAHVILEWGTICEKHLNVSYIFQISYLLHVNRAPLGKSSYIFTDEAWKQAGNMYKLEWEFSPHKSLFSGNHIG